VPSYAGIVRKGQAIAVVTVAAALVAVLIYGVASQGTDTSIDDSLADGERVEAASTSLPRLGAAGEQSLADYRGKVVLVNFWASWCPPCKDELPLLERTQKRIEGQNATILGINHKDLPGDAAGVVKQYKLTYPNLRDRDGEYADEYGAAAFPETFVIDRQGRIAALKRGPVDQRWLDETLPPILGEES
jgi:cytochrome c biogenesis protein CcmG/thiol:disulfide interchange protein DsbE